MASPPIPPLTLIHIVLPFILLIPLLTLTRPNPPRLDAPEGIRPITIQRVIPRRGWIILLLTLLALTAFLDGGVSVAILVLGNGEGHDGAEDIKGLNLVGWWVYPIGGLLVWGCTAIALEWRGRWGDRALKAMIVLALVAEIPNLVFLVLREVHAVGTWRILSILSIPPSGLRILLLPILLIVASRPIVKYEPAESEPSIEDDARDVEGSSSGSTARVDDPNGKPNTGSNTPDTQAKKQSIIIPKKLGEKKDEDEKPPPTWAEVWARFKKVSPHLWPSTSIRLQFHVVGVIILILINRVFTPITPIIFGKLVQNLGLTYGGQQGPSPWPWFIAYFGIKILRGDLMYFLQQMLWVPVTQYTDREMQIMCFNHLINLSLSYHTKRNTGEALKIIDRGSAINNLFSTVLFTLAPSIIDVFVGFGVFYWLFGAVLSILSLVVMVLFVCVSVILTTRRSDARREYRDKDVKQRGIMSDVLTNWESVKYFTAEDREKIRYKVAVVDFQKSEWDWNLSWQGLYMAQGLLLSFGLIVGSLVVSMRIMRGEIDASQIVVFIQYFGSLSSPWSSLGNLYSSLNRNSIDAEKMFALLAETTEVNDKPGAKDLVLTDGVVEFDDVHFSYDGKKEALKGVSFKIDKGTSMALVGESGSGKSTILRLLYRFYDVKSGVIRIDGQDISEVTQLSLRKAIGIVPQDSVLWNDTIGANVAYGKEDAEDDEIISASKAAKLHDKIMGFSDKYATIVGERGIRLSGGEKQRVSLARMFLKSPAILMLDEATSALDTETEREIQRSLRELAKGRTSLSIAHRLSTIINSDWIAVMKEGRIIEHGSYRELQDAKGAFATMWKNQVTTEAERLAEARNVFLPSSRQSENDLINLGEASATGSGEGKDDSAAGSGGSGSGDVVTSITRAMEVVADSGDATKDTTGDKQDKGEQTAGEAHSTYAQAVQQDESTSTHVPPGSDATPIPAIAETAPGSAKPVELVPADGERTPTATPAQLRETPMNSSPERRVSFPPSTGPTSFPTSEALFQSPSSTSHDSPSQARPSSRSNSRPPSRASRANTASPDLSASGHSLPGGGGPLGDMKRDKPDKTEGISGKRTRLSSLKGLVRRISDQGAARVPSGGSGSGGSGSGSRNVSGTGGEVSRQSIDEEAAIEGSGSGSGAAGQDGKDKKGGGGKEKRKKRLSMKN